MKIEKVEYEGWPNCYRISNGTVELIATSDVGPRIIRYAFVGGENIFGVFAETLGKTGGPEWRSYGGHRLWHAPEVRPRTYHPDNEPVKATVDGSTLKLVQPTETTTLLQKEIEVTLDPTGSHVTVVHRLRNNGQFAVETAPWALSVMAKGGRGIYPREPYAPHSEALLPVGVMTMWAYTNLADPRWYWGRKYIALRQDPDNPEPQKLGLTASQGWAAYNRGAELFIKRFTYHQGARYPDMGSALETFTNDAILEIETLGPLASIEPGATAEHVEHWFLYKDVRLGDAEDAIDAALQPLIRETGGHVGQGGRS